MDCRVGGDVPLTGQSYHSPTLSSGNAEEVDLRETPASPPIRSTTQKAGMTALNFASAISISSLFHPSHEASQDPLSARNGATSTSFLLMIADIQEKLNRVCQALKLTLQQIQSL